jgi:hypothetical protein
MSQQRKSPIFPLLWVCVTLAVVIYAWWITS